MMIAFGLTMIPSGRTAILAFTMPILSVPLSAWLLGDRITARKIGALALGMAGMALLLGEEFATLGHSPLGALLALGAAFTWAIGTVLQKRWPLGLPMGTFTAWTMLLGGGARDPRNAGLRPGDVASGGHCRVARARL